jgi:hypothetical protein
MIWSKFGIFPETPACGVGVDVISTLAVAVAGFIGVRVAGWATVGLRVGPGSGVLVAEVAGAQLTRTKHIIDKRTMIFFILHFFFCEYYFKSMIS